MIEGLSRSEKDFEAWTERFREYHDTWLDRGFVAMFRRLMAEEGVKPRLLGQPGGERMLTNYLHLSEALNAASLEEKLGMKGLVSWLSLMRQGIDRGSDENQLRLESDDEAVRIITVHKSKGLEFPIVFCPFLWGSSGLRDRDHILFHDRKKDTGLFSTWDQRG